MNVVAAIIWTLFLVWFSPFIYIKIGLTPGGVWNFSFITTAVLIWAAGMLFLMAKEWEDD